MLAGLASCLVGAFPSLTAQDIILLMKQNAHQFGQPDSLLGYGIPNMCPLFAGNWEQGMEQLIIYPNPFEESIQLKALTHGELIVYDAIGRVIYQDQIVPGIQAVKINNWSPECYTFEFRSEQGSVTKRVVKN